MDIKITWKMTKVFNGFPLRKPFFKSVEIFSQLVTHIFWICAKCNRWKFLCHWQRKRQRRITTTSRGAVSTPGGREKEEPLPLQHQSATASKVALSFLSSRDFLDLWGKRSIFCKAFVGLYRFLDLLVKYNFHFSGADHISILRATWIFALKITFDEIFWIDDFFRQSRTSIN